jgi:hypothetical protein
MAMSMKMAVFWVVAPCRMVRVYQHFGSPYCLHHQGDGGGPHVEAIRTSETMANSYHSTWCHNPEDNNLSSDVCWYADNKVFNELRVIKNKHAVCNGNKKQGNMSVKRMLNISVLAMQETEQS